MSGARRLVSERHGPAVRAVGALMLAALVLGGCRGEGPTTLTAVFDDVRHLAPRHAVRVADAQVGQVTGIELDGFRARVTLEIEPRFTVPEGTTAAVRQSSLLGENFVELRYPDDPGSRPALASGTVIEDTTTVVELEDLAREAIDVVGAISAGDVDTILEAGVQGIGGRGEQLGQLVTRVADLSEEYAVRSATVGEVLEGLGTLGGDLADGRDAIVAAIDEAARASRSVGEQRDRLVGALDELARMSRTVDDTVLRPHADDLAALLADLRPITRTLVGQRGRLVSVVDGLDAFARQLPRATPDGPIQVFTQVRTTSGLEAPVSALIDLLTALFRGVTS